MKFLILSMASMLFCIGASAQSSAVSASASATAASISVDWSIGEVVDGTNAIFLVTGDIDKEEKGPSVYPVPFERDFFIKVVAPGASLEFTIFDSSGRQVTPEFEVEGAVYRIHGSSLAIGLYILSIKQQNSNTSHALKIIKK